MVGDGLVDPNKYSGGWGPMQDQPQQPQQQQQPQLSREDYRDKWMSSGVKDNAGLDSFLQQYGGTRLSGNGTVKTPYGDDVIDMLIGARSGGNGSPGWTGLPSQSMPQYNMGGSNGMPSSNNTGIIGGGAPTGSGGIGDWLKSILGQFNTGNGGYQSQVMPRQQDMEYKPLSGMGRPNPISNYFMNGPGGFKNNPNIQY